MSYINVGATLYGRRIPTKAKLRAELGPEGDWAGVAFDVTSMLGPRAGEVINATATDIGTDKLTVVGPDPYTKRNWYATVEVRNGKIKVS